MIFNLPKILSATSLGVSSLAPLLVAPELDLSQSKLWVVLVPLSGCLLSFYLARSSLLSSVLSRLASVKVSSSCLSWSPRSLSLPTSFQIPKNGSKNGKPSLLKCSSSTQCLASSMAPQSSPAGPSSPPPTPTLSLFSSVSPFKSCHSSSPSPC